MFHTSKKKLKWWKTLELPIEKHDNKTELRSFWIIDFIDFKFWCLNISNFHCFFFYFSPSLSTPRGRPWRTSSWSLLTPAPRWVMDASKLPRTKWPSWDPSKRMLPRQNPLHKYFPIIYFMEKIMFNSFFVNKVLAAYFPSIKQLHVGNIWWILKKTFLIILVVIFSRLFDAADIWLQNR